MKLQTLQDDGSYCNEILYRRDNRFFTEQVDRILHVTNLQHEKLQADT